MQLLLISFTLKQPINYKTFMANKHLPGFAIW